MKQNDTNQISLFEVMSNLDEKDNTDTISVKNKCITIVSTGYTLIIRGEI